MRLVELIGGAGHKTRLLVEALLDQQDRLDYLPINISRVWTNKDGRFSSNLLLAS